MLSCFDLKPNYSIEEFDELYATFIKEMRNAGLVESTDKIGQRQRDTPMDTDDEREHEYFVLMSFKDRAQVDKAYAHIMKHVETGQNAHNNIYSKVVNPIFICWKDIKESMQQV